MKLRDIFEFRVVGMAGGDASRPTPVSNVKVSPPLPDELCKDRTYCERKKKKKKGKKFEVTRII